MSNGVFTAYYWSGSAWVQIGSTYNYGSNPGWSIQLRRDTWNSNPSWACTFDDFTVNTGIVQGYLGSIPTSNHTHADTTQGGIVSHTVLSGIGTNTHDQIDSALSTLSSVDTTKWTKGGDAIGSKKTFGSTDACDVGIITNNIERITVLSSGNVKIGGLSAYANNAAAVAAGLTAGVLYRTGADPDVVCVVH
ncbi:MAG: hypothetical protein HQK58_14200 [Deltaproteobacteria bacterium]|nr:hypothetical protein [Deltaproteobacteria bacterium]